MPFTNNILAKKRTPTRRVEKRRPRCPRRNNLRSSARSHQLPSPLPSHKDCGQATSASKRNQTAPDDSIPRDQDRAVKRRSLVKDRRPPSDKEEYDPIAYWVFNKDWPQDFAQRGRMADSAVGAKRKSDSTHRSSYIQRLEEQGIYIRASARIQTASKILCSQFLDERRAPPKYTSFPAEQLLNVIDRIHISNESRIQRDITPWIVPSAETLHFCGEPGLEYIGDEMNAKWIRCATLGGKIPQPDYAAGLLPKAFTKEERDRLMNYCSTERPFYFTAGLCYPFLVCEVKTGERGMGEADRQNIHSASIAVKAIIELHKAAFGKSMPEKVSDLYGKVLVFSVSHNHDSASLHGHYATLADDTSDTLEYYRHKIALVSLNVGDGVDSLTVYGFVRNIYDKFAKEHLQRIKDATASLPKPTVRTGLSFATSHLAFEQSDSQEDTEEGSGTLNRTHFVVPNLPASATKLFEQQRLQLEQYIEEQRLDRKQKEQLMEKRMEQQRLESKQKEQLMEKRMEQQRLESKQKEQLMEKRMEQQRLESKQKEQQMEKRMEQQRLESKEKEQQMEKRMEEQRQQMEQQRQQMEQQRQQMEEIISLLRKPQS